MNFWNKNPEKAHEKWELNLKVFYIVEGTELESAPNTVSLSYGMVGPEKTVVLGEYTIEAKS